jgi:hypothetical protein
MGEIVKFPPSTLADDYAFIVDMARFADGLLTEKQIRKKYHFDAATWKKLGSDDALVEKIEAEKERRIRDGSTKRERAQVEVIDAAPILGKIMRDPNANERHRIDSVKALDALAANGPEAVPAADRFIIRIDISGDGRGEGPDVLHFNKSIAVNPNDDPNDTDTAPQKLITDNGNGEPV